jgi:hypothetical protein
VVTLVKFELTEDAENTGITFETCLMQRNFIENVENPAEAAIGIFQSNATDQSMNFITQSEQMLG